MKYILLTLLLTASLQTHAESFLKKGKIKDIILKEIANLNLSTSIKVLDFDKIKGLGAEAQYKYEMTPSYIKDKYSRIDEWQLNRSIDAGSLLNGITPFYFNMEKSDRVTFIRHFETQKKAMLALPYSVNKIPYDAQSTLKRLKVGDFVSIPARMSFNAGVSGGYAHTPLIQVKGSVAAVLTGNFNINMYRVDDKRVRLKIVTRKSSSIQVGSNFKAELLVTNIKLVDKLTNRFELEPYNFSLSRGNGEQYILDYEFDLTDPVAAAAFDKILKPRYRFNADRIINQYRGKDYIDKLLISDFKDANELSIKNQGVKKLFQGFNNYNYKRREFGIKLFITKLKTGMTYYKNNITLNRGEGSEQYSFPNKVFSHTEELNLLVHKRKDQIEESYFSFIPKAGTHVKDSVDFGINYLRKDRYLTHGEWKSVRRKVSYLLPPEIYKKIDFSNMSKKETNFTTEIRYRLILKKDIFNLVIDKEIEDIIREIEEVMNLRGYQTALGKSMNAVSKKIFWFRKSRVKYLSKMIYKITSNREITADKKLEKVIDNVETPLFKNYFYRTVLGLVPNRSLSDLIYFKLDIYGNKTKPINFVYGEHTLPAIYHEILALNRDFHDSKRDYRIILE